MRTYTKLLYDAKNKAPTRYWANKNIVAAGTDTAPDAIGLVFVRSGSH